MAKIIQCQKCENYIDEKLQDKCPVCGAFNESPMEAYAGYPNAKYVKVVDFDMSFINMINFMVKWVIASIPAMIILFIIFVILFSIFGTAIFTLFQ